MTDTEDMPTYNCPVCGQLCMGTTGTPCALCQPPALPVPPVEQKLEIPMTLEEQIKAAMAGEKLAGGAQRGGKGRSKKSKLAVADPSMGQPLDGTIYRAVHVYQRTGEDDSAVRLNGQREARAAGPGTVVFTHYHVYGDECFDACKAKEVTD